MVDSTIYIGAVNVDAQYSLLSVVDITVYPSTGKINFAGQAPAFTGGTNVSGLPDLNHSIHQDLVYFVGSHPSDSEALGRELVGDVALNLFGSANLTAIHPDRTEWRCLQTINTNTSGAWSALSDIMKTISGNFTIWVDLIFNAVGTSSNILCVPWSANANWITPYLVFDYSRNGSTTGARWQLTPINSYIFYNGVSNSFPTSLVRKRLWVRRTGTALAFGVDGSQVGADITVSSAAPNWSGDPINPGNKVVLGNHKPEAPGEGLAATFLRTMVYRRALSNTELTDLNNDPLLGLRLDIVPDVIATPNTGFVYLVGRAPTVVVSEGPSFAASPRTGEITIRGQLASLTGAVAPLVDTDARVFVVEIDLILPGIT